MNSANVSNARVVMQSFANTMYFFISKGTDLNYSSNCQLITRFDIHKSLINKALRQLESNELILDIQRV